MGKDLEESLLLPVYYSGERMRVLSPRYAWKNDERGAEPFVILQWTHAGEGRFDFGKKTWSVPANHVFVAVLPEASTYYYPPDGRKPWVFSWINFHGARACDLWRKFRAEFGPVIALEENGAAAASLRRLIALTGRTKRQQEQWQISAHAYTFMLEWWQESSQPRRSSQGGLARALRLARERFREPLAVKQLAHEAGMSREHFSRVFLRETGRTPAAYLRGLRLKEAARFLRETTLPLGEIAMRSGFGSARHLMKAFTTTRGMSPSRYRGKAG